PPASLPPGVEAKNANRSHVRSTLTFRFPGWLLWARPPLYTKPGPFVWAGAAPIMPTMLGRQNAMPQNPVPAAPPSTRPHQHREVDGIFKTVQSFDGVAEDIILSVRVVGELELGYNWAASILCVRNMEGCDAVRQRRFHFPQLLGRCLHSVRL